MLQHCSSLEGTAATINQESTSGESHFCRTERNLKKYKFVEKEYQKTIEMCMKRTFLKTTSR